MSNFPHYSQMDDFYGNPQGRNGLISPKWEKENLVYAKAPWQLRTSWGKKPMSGIRVHKKCSASLEKILNEIWVEFGRSHHAIAKAGMNLCGGGFTFRLMRNSNALSIHAWGAAVDFDPARNGLGNNTPAMDMRVVKIFEKYGWEWGGRWSYKDGMHFQASHT